jgi:predicted RecA/RadA family phage recombinase
MALEASMRSGDPVMVDYTPGSGNVAAGEVVLLGNTAGITCGVAHKDIENGVAGELAVGGGVYAIKVASNYAAWTKVYWDDANSVLTSTSTNMSQFGYTVEASAAANSVVQTLHHPRA